MALEQNPTFIREDDARPQPLDLLGDGDPLSGMMAVGPLRTGWTDWQALLPLLTRGLWHRQKPMVHDFW